MTEVDKIKLFECLRELIERIEKIEKRLNDIENYARDIAKVHAAYLKAKEEYAKKILEQ